MSLLQPPSMRGDAVDVRTWRPAGPVAQRFGVCAAPIAMIVGPTGSGKTTEACRRYLRVASWQHPSPIDGVRKARILTICPTYRRAWDQIIPSYFEVYARSMGEFRGSRGDPADHTYDFDLNVGGELRRLHVEVLFRAVNDIDIEDFFRGFLFTAIDLPEADTNGDLAQILSLGSNRVGRYPTPEDRPERAETPSYAGIFGSANAPVIGSAFHNRFYMKRLPNGDKAPATDRLFTQPSGFSVNAENMASLRKIRPDYYQNMAGQLDTYDVGRMVENKPGFGRHGQPVHPNFDHETHVATRALEPDPNLPVEIGVDAGSNALVPGVTFSQRAYSGQWRTLAEIHLPDGQMNTEELGREIVHLLNTRFGQVRLTGARETLATLHLDPAAGGRNAGSEYTTAAALQAYTQIEAVLAPSNDPKFRRGAIDRLFKRMIAPKEPAKIIDPGCVGLIGGYAGGFHYPKRGAVVGLTPAKTGPGGRFSHVVEADEYAALSVEGLEPAEERFIRRDGAGPQTAMRAILPD